MTENWKAALAAGALAASSLVSPSDVDAADTKKEPTISIKNSTGSPESYISQFENNKGNKSGGWNDSLKKWFPHKSYEGGSDTIAYGHKILPGENFKNGLSDSEALSLLRKDISKKEAVAKKNIPKYDSLPQDVKNAVLNALYRGDMGPKTISHINNDKWYDAAKEYLNHAEYRKEKTRGSSIAKRMESNALQFLKMHKK